jgi:hypothetical protein
MTLTAFATTPIIDSCSVVNQFTNAVVVSFSDDMNGFCIKDYSRRYRRLIYNKIPQLQNNSYGIRS